MSSQIFEIFTHPEDGSDGGYRPRDIPAEEITAWFTDSLSFAEGFKGHRQLERER